MTGLDVPSRTDIEDLALRDTTLRHCIDVRIASKCMSYEDLLRMAVDRLVREKEWWRDRCLAHERAIAVAVSAKRHGGA